MRYLQSSGFTVQKVVSTLNWRYKIHCHWSLIGNDGKNLPCVQSCEVFMPCNTLLTFFVESHSVTSLPASSALSAGTSNRKYIAAAHSTGHYTANMSFCVCISMVSAQKEHRLLFCLKAGCWSYFYFWTRSRASHCVKSRDICIRRKLPGVSIETDCQLAAEATCSPKKLADI